MAVRKGASQSKTQTKSTGKKKAVRKAAWKEPVKAEPVKKRDESSENGTSKEGAVLKMRKLGYDAQEADGIAFVYFPDGLDGKGCMDFIKKAEEDFAKIGYSGSRGCRGKSKKKREGAGVD